jgi:hypothetical protein
MNSGDKVSASREKHKISLLIFDSERSLTSLFDAKVMTIKRFYPIFVKQILFINRYLYPDRIY